MEVQALSPETIQDTLASPTAPVPLLQNVTPIPSPLIDTTFSTATNLSGTALGARVLSFSDEYFASASNLLTSTPAVRKPGVYVHTGAWYDGWETRRHNPKEFDWVVIKLGCVGTIKGVEVDTAHFNGNEAPAAGLDGCFVTEEKEQSSGVEHDSYKGWKEILPPQACGPSQRQAWSLEGVSVAGQKFTHLRLKMYPDGGIARLRVYGSAVPPPLPEATIEGELPLEELSSALNGGVAISCSDQHFGVKSNLLLPGRGKDMGDGWETARSRTKGHTDWVICRLGLRGRAIEKVVVDTKDFRGNFPRAVKVEGLLAPNDDDAAAAADPVVDSEGWVPLIKGEQPCAADFEHIFEGGELMVHPELGEKAWTHVKMTILPDGGVKRLRVFGRRT